MAIYIGLKIEEKRESLWVYKFFSSDGSPYGRIAVDTETKEIELLGSVDGHAETFAFPRAKRAIEKALKDNALGDELCYAA